MQKQPKAQEVKMDVPGADVRIEINAGEEITLTLKGSTVAFFAQVLEDAPLPRKAYLQLSQDFTSALQKAKAQK